MPQINDTFVPVLGELDENFSLTPFPCRDRNCTLNEAHTGLHVMHNPAGIIEDIWGQPLAEQVLYLEPSEARLEGGEGLWEVDSPCGARQPTADDPDDRWTCSRVAGHLGPHLAMFGEDMVCRDGHGRVVSWRESDNGQAPIIQEHEPPVKTKKVAYEGSPLLQISVRRAIGTRDLTLRFKSEVLAQYVDEIHASKGWVRTRTTASAPYGLPPELELRCAATVFEVEYPVDFMQTMPNQAWWVFLTRLRYGHEITVSGFVTRKHVKEWLTKVRALTTQFYTEHLLPIEYDLELVTRSVERMPNEVARAR
jgi:hypothetical protein